MINNKKVIGFICECNPFHKGHKKLIDTSKKLYNADIIVAVMSGDFIQRGEPAIYDKYYRTKELLKNNVDIVIEIPVEYSLSSAKFFANAGVSILNKLGFVDNIIFGSQINDINELSKLSLIKSDIDNFDNDKIDNDFKTLLKKGLSYPATISKIYDTNLSSNDILGIEYLNALKVTKSKIKPLCIKRDNKFPSASSLRKKIKPYIRTNDFSDILNEKIIFAKTHNENFLDISGITKDINNAIFNNYNKYYSFDEFSNLLNTKNRTLANIKRLLFNIILNIKKTDIQISKNNTNIKFIKILGIKKEAIWLLKNIKIPFLLNFAPLSYKNLLKKFPKTKLIKKSNGTFIINEPSIKNSIFANDLYYTIASKNINKSNESKFLIDFANIKECIIS